MAEPKGQRIVSVVDVAAEAGVSTSTAARVLRGSRYRVSAELSEKVQAAAIQLGYVPNVLARSFRAGRQASVGLIVGDMLDPYFGTVSEEVTVGATNASLVALVCNMQRDPALEIALCERLWGYRVGGIILASGGTSRSDLRARFDSLLTRMMAEGVVAVTLTRRSDGIPTIGVDNEEVGELIATRLLALGHHDIGLLAGPEDNLTQQARLAGLRRVLDAAGAPLAVRFSGFLTESGAEGVDALLSERPNLTAIVGGSDSVAFGAVRRLTERGYAVPGDVSVVGIGNTSLAALAQPRLATVEVHLARSARLAVDTIAARLDGSAEVAPPPLHPHFVDGPSLSTRKLTNLRATRS
ncbi:MAG: LacI family DNA-binding transcriptional regulator [Chloroflexota bacterium]